MLAGRRWTVDGEWITATPTKVSSLIFCSLQVFVRASFLESALFRRASIGLWFAFQGTKRIRRLVMMRPRRNSGAAAALEARAERVKSIAWYQNLRITKLVSKNVPVQRFVLLWEKTIVRDGRCLGADASVAQPAETSPNAQIARLS
jgi:hypothetical protein